MRQLSASGRALHSPNPTLDGFPLSTCTATRDSGLHNEKEPTVIDARNDRTGPTKIVLDESELPTQWYNLVPDLPSPPPPVLHPGTLAPVGPDDLAPLFPLELIGQEVTGQQYVDIPGAVLDVYRLWRPSPLYRAYRLEKALDTPARIYYKYEGVSPAGSHKPNTAVPQAYYNAQAGIRRLTTVKGH
jgi:tryptophan synthase beta chain